ncbi:MAG: hypothetical protein ACXACI_09820 [Candidatus Hodarchaeales archaeon]
MPSLSNSIIIFACFSLAGDGLAIVAVVPFRAHGREELTSAPYRCKRHRMAIAGQNGIILPWPIAERRVNRRSSQEFSLATGMIGVRGSSATRAVPGLRSEKAIVQVQPSVKRELPRIAGLRGLAGSSVLQDRVVHPLCQKICFS